MITAGKRQDLSFESLGEEGRREGHKKTVVVRYHQRSLLRPPYPLS